MDGNLVCPCGLTCCDCLFYKSEIYEAAQRLKEVIKKYDFDKFLILLSKTKAGEAIGEHLLLSEEQARDKMGKYFESFKQTPEFMNSLESIIHLQCKTTCKEAGGCSMGGKTHECDALKCIKMKGFDGCWQCAEYKNCARLDFLKKNYGEVIEDNLRTIHEKGINAVKSRGNTYYVWQRK
jgi:hypothetical protein